MSGIAGVIGEEDTHTVKKMIERMEHRGGKKKTITGKNFAFCVASSNACDVYASEETTCILDGLAVWHRFKGAEAIARSSARGKIEQCMGAFAGVVWNGKEFHLFRDHFGVRPMYYAKVGELVYFASELKGFLPLLPCMPEYINPGEEVIISEGKTHRRRYHVLKAAERASECSMDAAIKKLDALLRRAVAFNLSEKCGALLSGGIDSSCIVWYASKKLPDLRTFTACFKEGSDDAIHAEALADELGIRHKTVEYDLEEMLAVLTDVIYYLESFDFALVRSAIPNYIVVREASRFVDALLSGEGGDELFAGYSYLKTIRGSLQEELIYLLYSAHNNAFQRDDRMFFAHGVEFRVPFVYQPVVEFAYTLPASYKIHNGVNKYVLRKLMNKIGLPEYITEREKRKFSDGAGSMFAIEKFVDAAIEDDAYRAAREKHSFLRYKEELYYFQIFTEHFPENWTHLVGFTKRPER